MRGRRELVLEEELVVETDLTAVAIVEGTVERID